MPNKYISLSGLLLVAVGLWLLLPQITVEKPNAQNISPEDSFIIQIPMSSSRPGCERSNLCYVPAEADIAVGKTITWINYDAAFHTVTSGFYDVADGYFDSGHLEAGQSFSFTFDQEGKFQYYCKLHPWMEGVVQVSR